MPDDSAPKALERQRASSSASSLSPTPGGRPEKPQNSMSSSPSWPVRATRQVRSVATSCTKNPWLTGISTIRPSGCCRLQKAIRSVLPSTGHSSSFSNVSMPQVPQKATREASLLTESPEGGARRLARHLFADAGDHVKSRCRGDWGTIDATERRRFLDIETDEEHPAVSRAGGRRRAEYDVAADGLIRYAGLGIGDHTGKRHRGHGRHVTEIDPGATQPVGNVGVVALVDDEWFRYGRRTRKLVEARSQRRFRHREPGERQRDAVKLGCRAQLTGARQWCLAQRINVHARSTHPRLAVFHEVSPDWRMLAARRGERAVGVDTGRGRKIIECRQFAVDKRIVRIGHGIAADMQPFDDAA